MDDQSNIIAGEAAVSAVLEPPRRRFFSRRRKTEPMLTHCENCGAPLAGPFCAQCGQHAVDYRRSFGRVLLDAADSFFNWDTKFLKSVGILLVKPWQLTNDFNAGRRARFVHPLRLYLLASIAFFLLARLIHFHGSDAFQFDPKDRAVMQEALAKLAAPDSALDPDERAKAEAARVKLSQINGPLTDADKREMRRALGLLISSSVQQELKPKDREKLSKALDRITQSPTPAKSPTADQTASPSDISPGPSVTPMPTKPPSSGLSVDYDDSKGSKSAFGTWIEKRIKEKIGEDGSKSQLFFDTLRSNIPTMMLCCIPLFALVLKVLYIRKRRFYVEHLVYALHIHSFAYVAVVVTTLLAMALARWSAVAEGLAIGFLSAAGVVLVFLSIRRVYGQGWFFTAFKFWLGGIAYFVILVTAVALTAFVTVLLPS